MNRLTPEWTRAQALLVFGALPVAFGTAIAASGESLPLALAIAALFIATAAVAMAFDPFIGLAVGLGGATALVLLKRLGGAWTPDLFVPSLLESLLLVFTGPLLGYVGSHLRGLKTRAASDDEDPAGSPVFSSLGFIPAELGQIRLEEELDRARRYGRALSVLQLVTEIPRETAPDVRDGIERAVARLLESMLRTTDVPFAFGSDCVAAILPETSAEGTLVLAARLMDATNHATFAVRTGAEAERHRVTDYATVRCGIGTFPENGETAGALMDAVRQASSTSRPEPAAASTGAAGKAVPQDGAQKEMVAND